MTARAQDSTQQGGKPSTLHVAPDGDDSGDGRSASPLKTVQKAIARCKPGFTVLIRPGVYKEFLHFNGLRGTQQRSIVFRGVRGADGKRPVIQTPTPNRKHTNKMNGVTLSECTFLRIEGLEIRDFHTGSGVRVISGANIAFVDCDIHHNADHPYGREEKSVRGHMGNGIGVNAATKNILFSRNLIHHNGSNATYDHGLYMRGTGHRIVNNLFYHNSGFGLQLYPEARKCVAANNVFAFHGKSGIILWSDKCRDNHVFNNIGYKNRQDLVATGGGASGNIIENNLGFGHGRGLVRKTSDNTFRNNRQGDPLFVHADRFDFRLRAGSPAIGSGLTKDAPEEDFSGRPRPRGTVSLGAFEFVD